MQKILTISRKNLPDSWLNNGAKVKLDISMLRESLDSITPNWMDRPKAEADSSFKQLIPYAVVRFGEKIACYRRSGDEKRLHELFSIGVGGHIDIEDEKGSVVDTIIYGLSRELKEEFADFSDESAEISFLGVINSEDSEVSSVHLGMVFEIKTTKQFQPGAELTGFDWATLDELKTRNLENWSALALSICE